MGRVYNLSGGMIRASDFSRPDFAVVTTYVVLVLLGSLHLGIYHCDFYSRQCPCLTEGFSEAFPMIRLKSTAADEKCVGSHGERIGDGRRREPWASCWFEKPTLPAKGAVGVAT